MKDTGGSAFPTLMKSGDLVIAEGGVTTREYFAAHAPVTMADAIAVCGYPKDFVPSQDSQRNTVFAILAMLRAEYADAMLFEMRDKEELDPIRDAVIAAGGKP